MLHHPVIISVAPNGSSKTKHQHPNLPILPAELAKEAKICQEAGATLIHLHVRNQEGNHTLDVSPYKDATKAIRDVVGNKIIIQVTSESVGMYSPQQQMEMIYELEPEAVSIAIKEFMPANYNETDTKEFLKWMLHEKISPQYVVYSEQELKRFYELKEAGIIPGEKHFVLFVLGRYSLEQESSPKDLLAFIKAFKKYELGSSVQWAVCAFGKSEASCMLTAAMLGGHVRIGFENNMHLMDGTLANNNAELITQFRNLYPGVKRTIATLEQAKQLILC